MKVVTTNLLNRFWTNGVKPIKDALTKKVDTSKIVNNLLTTTAGYVLDARQGKVLQDRISQLNTDLDAAIKTVVVNKNSTTVSAGPFTISVNYSVPSGYIILGVVGWSILNSTKDANVTCVDYDADNGIRILGYASTSVLIGARITLLLCKATLI